MILATKEEQWSEEKKFLQEEIERYKQLSNVEYMESLEELVESQKAQISELTTQTTHLLKEN